MTLNLITSAKPPLPDEVTPPGSEVRTWMSLGAYPADRRTEAPARTPRAGCWVRRGAPGGERSTHHPRVQLLTHGRPGPGRPGSFQSALHAPQKQPDPGPPVRVESPAGHGGSACPAVFSPGPSSPPTLRPLAGHGFPATLRGDHGWTPPCLCPPAASPPPQACPTCSVQAGSGQRGSVRDGAAPATGHSTGLLRQCQEAGDAPARTRE